MFAPTVSMTYKKQPLEVLNQLIEKRRQYIADCARDAVLGTAITALVSIRAITKDARKRKRLDNAFSVEDTGYYGGYSNSEHKCCVRQGIGKWSPKVQMDAPVLFPRRIQNARQYLKHIYRVTTTRKLRGKEIGRYYICAYSEAEAADRERKLIKKSIYRTGGLALNVLGSLMKNSSSQNPPHPEGSAYAQMLGEKFGVVSKGEAPDGFFCEVVDTLNYAVSAVKGREGGINLALMRAANKISGMIRHHWHTPLDHDVGTPFPEIVRSR